MAAIKHNQKRVDNNIDTAEVLLLINKYDYIINAQTRAVLSRIKKINSTEEL